MEICATSSVSRLGKGLAHPRMGFSRRVDQMEAFPVALRLQGERPLSLDGGFVRSHPITSEASDHSSGANASNTLPAMPARP